MKPDFSEFTYGYAVTEELVHYSGAVVVGAPTFPSLYQEGKSGGFDVNVPFVGVPVFLQFKLCDRLHRTSARESREGILSVPYLRMHIRPAKHSEQHQLLLDLESSGETVFYVAPEFHKPAELNHHYLSKTVVPNSAAFSPKDIGPMPDSNDHYIVFKPGEAHGYRCSQDPREVPKVSLRAGIREALHGRSVDNRKVDDGELRRLSSRMLEVIRGRESAWEQRESSPDTQGIERVLDERTPRESASYIARAFFDAELVLIK